ncbi:uncharacterized protein MYCFIDRAFT_173600 [Pseudocercospora fijiensis CIRAD86]|uniref:Uncharacterized protein n=1 Tax=Pseudocercospora fijiensis (strain CIRAD86) TaxID=383855 RepID=M3AJ87_PSEFD|nr:uncharacterized protein MYCFIDRAFT_173600 [Pseudocercospora fijiensis CIRAD86]EME84651.1 hypothetical protein MYCFIDRAFT_173600 [Pseudocercospora fijiensis CIRAD86]
MLYSTGSRDFQALLQESVMGESVQRSISQLHHLPRVHHTEATMAPIVIAGRRCIAILAIVQSLLEVAAASGLATVTPCPDCGPSIAPRPISVTAQYQTVSTCVPSTTTVTFPKTKHHTTTLESAVKTIPSCTSYAWVSTEIPWYMNGTATSTLVTTTNQPVTFNSLHYTETHTTTITLPSYDHGNRTNHTSTLKVSETTIDIKDFCDYKSIGPIGIPGYGGSGLCKDCGPDSKRALTQRFTVISCANRHCTTFNETRIASPTTYTRNGRPHVTTTTHTYCPTATPASAIPRESAAASTAVASTTTTATQPTGYDSKSAAGPTTSPTATPSVGSEPDEDELWPSAGPSEYEPTTTADETEPTYGGGEGSADPSADLEHDEPAPTPYQPPARSYKAFKRQGLEKPKGRLVKLGMLYRSRRCSDHKEISYLSIGVAIGRHMMNAGIHGRNFRI